MTYIAKHYKVSRPTVYKWIRELKEARKGKQKCSANENAKK